MQYVHEINTGIASAKIFAKEYDQEALSQVYKMLSLPYMAGSKIRFMPDMHAGAGCTIGTTMTITDKVCPNFVGVDIGCGMESIQIFENELDLPKLDTLIREKIPAGQEIRQTVHPLAKKINLSQLHCAKHVDLDRAYRSIGTLGGGNHFIEANRDDDGNIYIVIHSGSRHLGLQVAKFYQEAAFKALDQLRVQEFDRVIKQLKAEHREAEISETLNKLKGEYCHPYSKEQAYVSGELCEHYLDDMRIAQHYATLNRKAMMDTIIEGMGLHVVDQFSTIHNYIDLDHMILRKGAVSAQAGERLIIPINMRDGSLICIGKGNEDWNCSAPHGAGRLFSRGQAKEMFTVEEFEMEMEGIYTTSVGQSTLDESPMAYKSLSDIADCIEDTVAIEKVIKPIYNFKAS